MNIYIDESGSINNHSKHNKFFIIALVHVKDRAGLKKAYKRFVSSNFDRLLALDNDKIDSNTGKIVKYGGKMFTNGRFKELKGSQFDREMKSKFIDFFSRNKTFEVYYIKINNNKLTDNFCENTARVFNYTLKLALEYFIKQKYLPNEDCYLQLDERNEKTETKFFLENYLNTELAMNGTALGKFNVTYFDSANNNLIQIADVFANLFYSQLQTNQYTEAFKDLQRKEIIKFIFEYPK